MSNKVTTVRAVVKALGGTGKAADFLEIVPSAVSNMLKYGEIPRSYHLRIKERLEAWGYEVDLDELEWVRPGDRLPPEHRPAA